LTYIPVLFMATTQEMTDRHAALLAEFADLCLQSARDLTARQIKAEAVHEAAELAGALHRVGRSLRQSMALEAKLRRDTDAALRVSAAQAAQDEEKHRRRRKTQVKLAVEQLVWTESRDEDEADDLLETFEHLLDAEALADGFCDEPLDDQIARITARLGPIPDPDRPPRRVPSRTSALAQAPAAGNPDAIPKSFVWESRPPPPDDACRRR